MHDQGIQEMLPNVGQVSSSNVSHWIDCLALIGHQMSAGHCCHENTGTEVVPPFPMSEDCLYLNIYTPARAHKGSNLPVSTRPWSAWVGEHYFYKKSRLGTSGSCL
jgi:hypothetical protein